MASSVSLVTGAAGFLGSHVADALSDRGHKVVALDDLSGGFRRNVPPGSEFIEGSILNADLVEALFEQYRFTYVFHLAAYAAEGLSHFIRRFNYQNNLLGSVNLINASVRAGSVRCFVFTSSIAVYGEGQVPMREEMTPMPEDPYGISKFAVELDLRSAHRQFGLNSIIFRPHNVYGERQNLSDPYRNVVGIFMRQALNGEPLTVFGDGKQTRAFSHHSEVCPIIAASAEREAAYNEVFNIGAGQPCSVLELADTVRDALGSGVGIRNLDARNEVVHAWASHEKVESFFGDLRKPISLRDGVARMAAWAQKIDIRQPRPFSGVEVDKNMPAAWMGMTQRQKS